MKERLIKYEGVVNVLRKIEKKNEKIKFLFYACEAEEFDLCDACLDSGIKINDFSSEGNILQCLIAYRKISIAILDWLISRGIDLNCKYCGITALNVACEYNNYEIAKYLVEKGAKITKCIDYEKNYGISDLELAFNTRNMELIELIFQAGAYTKTQLMQELKGLNRAVMDRKYDVAELYLKFFKKNNIYPNLYDKEGRMAIHIAVFHADEDMVKLLLENNADPNAKIRRGSRYKKDYNVVTPMDIAIYYKNEVIQKLLASYGGKRNIQ